MKIIDQEVERIEESMFRVREKLVRAGMFFGVLLVGLVVLIGLVIGGFFDEEVAEDVAAPEVAECGEVDYSRVGRVVRIGEEFRLDACETVRVAGGVVDEIFVTLRSERVYVDCVGDGYCPSVANVVVNVGGEYQERRGEELYVANVVREDVEREWAIVNVVAGEGLRIVGWGEAVVIGEGEFVGMVGGEREVFSVWVVADGACGANEEMGRLSFRWRRQWDEVWMVGCGEDSIFEVVGTDGESFVELRIGE